MQKKNSTVRLIVYIIAAFIIIPTVIFWVIKLATNVVGVDKDAQKFWGTWRAELDITADMEEEMKAQIREMYPEEWTDEYEEILESYDAACIYTLYVDFCKDGTCRFYVNEEEYKEALRPNLEEMLRIVNEIEDIKGYTVKLDEEAMQKWFEEAAAARERKVDYYINGELLNTMDKNGTTTSERFVMEGDTLTLYATKLSMSRGYPMVFQRVSK